MLAESSSHNVPLRTDPGPWAVPDPLDVDLVDASRRMGDSIRLLRARLAEGADE